jgi:hypothetical protein
MAWLYSGLLLHVFIYIGQIMIYSGDVYLIMIADCLTDEWWDCLIDEQFIDEWFMWWTPDQFVLNFLFKFLPSGFIIYSRWP